MQEGLQVPGWFPVPMLGRMGVVIGVECHVGVRPQLLQTAFYVEHQVSRNPGVWECGLNRSR